jgi:Spy/CpxP family protein refolding chaperone
MTKWILLAASLPALLSAQMPHGFWWEGRIAKDLNLTEAQQKQISTIGRDYSPKLFHLREAQRKAEGELEVVFDESPVDQKKWSEAIDHLTAARAELFRATSQMELSFRNVLTSEQWEELKKRGARGPGGPGRPGGPPGGPRRRGGPGSKDGTITTSQPQQQP